MTFEVSWDLVDNAYVPVIGGLFCTNVPASSCDVTNPPQRYYDAAKDGTNFNLLVPGTNVPGSGAFTVILHNTTNTVPPGGRLLFNLVSSETLDVLATNWASEMLVWGIPNESNATAVVDTAGRDNLFFWAYSISNAATVVELDFAKYATGIVNGVTTNFPHANVDSVEPVLYGLSMGYDGEDLEGALYGGTDPYASWRVGAQGVTRLYLDPSARLSVTNVFMANNLALSSVDLGNLYSVQELWIKGCNQSGELAPVSTNLLDVWAENQYFTSADFTGRELLTNCIVYNDRLTNLVIAGCSKLILLDAHDNRLGDGVINDILCFLDISALGLKYLDLSGPENGVASGAGLTSYSNLTNRAQVHVNFEDTSTPAANSIVFVTVAPITMEVTVTPDVESILWHSYRGGSSTNTFFEVPNTGRQTNWVTVTPASALTGFGELNNLGKFTPYSAGVETINNLAAFPNLATLGLWGVGLQHMDLTDCHSLTLVRVAGNPQSQATTDSWLSQLAAASPPAGGDFRYNDSGPNCWAAVHSITNSIVIGSEAYHTLTNASWTFNPWCN